MASGDETGSLTTGGSRSSSAIVDVVRIVVRSPALRRVELAFVTFNSAEWGTWIAMIVYAYARGGVTESGIVATAMLAPAAVLAPVAAAVSERFPPGRSLTAAYVVQASTCGVVAVALFAHANAYLVYVLLVLPAVAFTLTRPTQSSFTPGLARSPEELTATNVASGWIESVSVLGAPALTGAILAVASPAAVFAVMGAACAVGAALVVPLRDLVPRAVADHVHEDDGAAGEGGALMLLRRDPHARMLVALLGAQCVALGALDVLYVALARGTLHRGPQWTGYLNAAFGAGGVLAVGVTSRLVGLRRLAGPVVLSLGAWAIAFVGVSLLPGVLAALVMLGIAGVRSAFDVAGRTLLQRVAPPGLLARVFGLLEGLEMAGYAVGALLAPALYALGGASATLLGVGALLPIMAFVSGRRLLEIDRHATVPVVEIALLRSVALFAHLPPPTLESLARALEPLAVTAGEVVIREGDEGDRYYVIADGELDVFESEQFMRTLGRGDGFGEIALLREIPRTATVVVRSPARLYALEREVFLLAVTGNPLVERAGSEWMEQPSVELAAEHA